MALFDVSVDDTISVKDVVFGASRLQALIKFTQSSIVGVGGEAYLGSTGSAVTVNNFDNTLVASWQIDLLYTPQGSTVEAVTPLAFNDNSATPSASFTPDVTGSYRLRLTIWDAINRAGNYDIDIRVFSIKEAGFALIRPPAQVWPLAIPVVESGRSTAKPEEMNFGNQPNGWSGVTGNGLLDDALIYLTNLLTGSAPVNVTKAAAAAGTATTASRSDHKHDVSTAAPGAAAIGDSATEGSATSLARSDHKHSVAGGTPVTSDKSANADGVATTFARSDHKHDISTAAPGAAAIGDSATEGTATSLARSDHKHSVAAGTPVAVDKSANSAGVATTFARSDHKHDITTATVTDITDSTNAEGSATSLARSDHTHSHGTRGGGTLHAVATTSTAGFMASGDKANFDGIVKAVKQPVRAATTANITLSGTQTVDAVALVATDRCLVKNQSTGANNGIYVVSAGAWTRATDFDADAEVAGGTVVPVSDGTANGNRIAILTTNDPITIGSTTLTFVMNPTLPGTTGNIPFHNGVDNFTVDTKLTYDDSTDQLTVPGVNLTEDFALQGDLSPSQITADQNDYNPTNLATASILRLNTDATRTITGLQGGADGRLLIVFNVGSNDIVLANESASSSAANRFTVGANFTIPPTYSVGLTYDSTSSRWRSFADSIRVPCLRTQLGAPDFDDPGTDWSVTAAAALAADTVNAGLTVRRFDDTTEEGVGWDVLIPDCATKIRFTIMSRAQTAPAATRTVGLALKKREIVDNAAVGSWSSTTLTDVSIPSNANFQRSTQTVTLSTLSLTANRIYQLELVRQNPGAGTELVGDWTLFTLLVEWLP